MTIQSPPVDNHVTELLRDGKTIARLNATFLRQVAFTSPQVAFSLSIDTILFSQLQIEKCKENFAKAIDK